MEKYSDAMNRLKLYETTKKKRDMSERKRETCDILWFSIPFEKVSQTITNWL